MDSRRKLFLVLLGLGCLVMGGLQDSALGQFEAFGEPWPPVVIFKSPEGGFSAYGSAEVKIQVVSEAGVHIYRDKLEMQFEKLEGASFQKLVLPDSMMIPDVLNPGEEIAVYEGEFTVGALFQVTAAEGEAVVIKGLFSLSGCSDEICYQPQDEAFAVEVKAGPGAKTDLPAQRPGEQAVPSGAIDETAVPSGATGHGAALPSTTGEAAEGSAAESEEGPGWAEVLLKVLAAFGAGVLLSLTPCVLPMIPITSAIIQRFSRGGKASALYASCLYVFGMSLTYAGAGVAVAFLGGSVRSALNSPWVLGSIGLLFAILSLSMFGLFDISMPGGMAGKLQQKSAAQSQKKNRFALILMGMISGIIAGPCLTAPLAGFLAWIATSSNPYIGFAIMFSLAWGIGLLIIVAGTSTGLVPRAGEWTEWFKKFFGFLMLWGALFFTQTLIGEMAYSVGTIVILITGAVFLGGLDSLPAEARWPLRIKKLIGVCCIMGAFFLGLHTFGSMDGSSPAASMEGSAVDSAFKPGSKADVEMALKKGTPLILDFTAEWCANCKVLKRNVLSKSAVTAALDGVVALEIDFDEETDLREKYKVIGPPKVVFIGGDGKEKADLTFTGTRISVEEFVQRVEQLK